MQTERIRRVLLASLFLVGIGVDAVAEPRSEAAERNTVSNKSKDASRVGFKTPSGNIVCIVNSQSQNATRFLRCDILSGLNPTPSVDQKAPKCEFDWVGIQLESKGEARPNCGSDSINGEGIPVLEYGASWIKAGFKCQSERDGLTCNNSYKHGFFLARKSWRVY